MIAGEKIVCFFAVEFVGAYPCSRHILLFHIPLAIMNFLLRAIQQLLRRGALQKMSHGSSFQMPPGKQVLVRRDVYFSKSMPIRVLTLGRGELINLSEISSSTSDPT